MHWLWVIVVGAMIGMFAGASVNKSQSLDWLAKVAAKLAEFFADQRLLRSWDPKMVSRAVFPDLKAVILVAVS